jgi:hypothetical protein
MIVYNNTTYRIQSDLSYVTFNVKELQRITETVSHKTGGC